MRRHLLYPGSFDPPTLGHLDLIRRGHALFPKLTVAVLRNGAKSSLFSVAERVAMLKHMTKGLRGVGVTSFDGLLVDYLKSVRNPVVLRGLRVVSDFEYEFQMALMNRKLDPAFEVLYLMPDERYSYISSSLVREVARLGGKVHQFVPKEVARRVHEAMRLKALIA
ncbi:MAG TPA: pantetheine-phosphate adenylyltransferase [bacterium]|jgi:pantetheine-phosphate adenylyltransferase|nr:pantetheine-phosphate adenylyltransferase [bacterium]